MPSVTYEISADDLASVYREPIVRSMFVARSWRRVRWPLCLVLGLGGIGVAWATAQGDRSGRAAGAGEITGAVALTLGSAVLVGAIAFGALVLRLPARMRRSASEGDFGSLVGTHAVEQAPDGLVLRSPTSETRVDWTSIYRIDAGRAFILIFLTPMRLHPIPLWAFDSPGGAAAFVEQARARMKAPLPPR